MLRIFSIVPMVRLVSMAISLVEIFTRIKAQIRNSLEVKLGAIVLIFSKNSSYTPVNRVSNSSKN